VPVWAAFGFAGDEAAYRRCLTGLSEYLRAYFRRRLMRDRDEVEDLVQETLLAIHTRRHTYRTDQPLTAWVHGIARYKLADWFRGHGGRVGSLDSLDDHENFFQDDLTAACDTARDIESQLAQLPDRWRIPIQLTKLEGQSVRDAAAACGMTESAIKVGVHRGLRALATLLEKQYFQKERK
jgi:RNA polymerase sigma-70 factor, ECF subfamily